MVRQAGRGERQSTNWHKPYSLGHALLAILCVWLSTPCGVAAEPVAKRAAAKPNQQQRSLAPNPQPAFENATAKPSGPRLAIDGRDIACRAACNWTIAEILRTRANTLLQIYCDEDACARQASQTLAHFLRSQAAYQEDIGAASAMRAYYSRIAITEQLVLADESLVLINLAEEKQLALRDRGISGGTDSSTFERRRLEVLDQRLRLESQDRQLRSLLGHLTDFDYASGDVYQEKLEIYSNPMNCSGLKQIAVAQRQDLCGWRYLAAGVNRETAPEFAKMLPTLVGGWTLPLPTLSTLKQLICPADYSCLAVNMKRELDLVIQQQSDWIRQTVEEKCLSLELSYRRIEIAQQVVASWRERFAQLERLAEIGDGKPEERATAEVELLKSRSEELNRRLEARIAEIDLAEAVGGLAGRCCRGQAWLLTGNE